MQTDCSPDPFGFAAVEGREVVAAFDGGNITSDAGGPTVPPAGRSAAVSLKDVFALR
jgi:hypothetical protein